MRIFCDRHNRYTTGYWRGSHFVNNGCYYCGQEQLWISNDKKFLTCNIHNIPFLTYCHPCKKSKDDEERRREEDIKTIARIRKYDDALKESDKHRNEKCFSCEKPLSFEEWFCYCHLCPECFLNSDEDVDNWLGEQPK